MVDEEKAKDIVFLDFRRAFENVCHKILRENKGIGAGWAHSEEGLKRVLISVTKSSWRPETIIVRRGSVLGPVLFNMLINGLGSGTVCTLGRFADDTKLGGVACTPEGRGAAQGVPDRLEQWAGRSLVQFHKDKSVESAACGEEQPCEPERLPAWRGCLQDRPVLGGNKVNTSQPRALVVKKEQWCPGLP